MTSSNIPTKIQIWDVAGVPNNNKHNNNNNSTAVNGAHTAAKCYYATSSAILLGYDVTSRSSYEGMRSWLNELRRTISFSVVVVAIVALKTDLLHNSGDTNGREVVQEYEVEQLAQALNVLYVPTSAKLDVNVTNLFSRVAEEVLVRRKRGMIMGGGGGGGLNNGHLHWNNGGGGVGQFTNGGRKKERGHNASNRNTTDSTRPSTPKSSKELYGKYYETDNYTTNTVGNHNAVDGNHHDHRDDSNTSSSMMLPINNDIMMMNGNSSNATSINNDNDPTSTQSITSSSIADGRSTSVAMSFAGEEGGGSVTNECDITMEVEDPDDGEEDQTSGSFFMMCGCGKTSDTIDE